MDGAGRTNKRNGEKLETKIKRKGKRKNEALRQRRGFGAVWMD